MTKLCVLGPSGRMGAMVCSLASNTELSLQSIVERKGHTSVGSELYGVQVTDDLETAVSTADVYIDFSSPEATGSAARAALAGRTAAVIGTTGLGEGEESAVDELSKVAPVLVAANFSLGVNLLCILAEQAARALGPSFDLEILEIHHRRKRDAPSGTAIALGESLAVGADRNFKSVARMERVGDVGARSDEEIGVVALRGGDVIGEHTAYLFGELERIELTHRAHSREIFAAGALKAASWLAGRSAGTYHMRDVLGL